MEEREGPSQRERERERCTVDERGRVRERGEGGTKQEEELVG